MTAQTVAMLPPCLLPVARVSSPERSHNAAIDGLRALAVLAVVLLLVLRLADRRLPATHAVRR